MSSIMRRRRGVMGSSFARWNMLQAAFPCFRKGPQEGMIARLDCRFVRSHHLHAASWVTPTAERFSTSKLQFADSTLTLVYSTYLGGTGDYDEAHGIAVDSVGNAYVTGITTSADFPTVNPLSAPNDIFQGSQD